MGGIFYNDSTELIRFYHPDVMIRRSYTRLSGSIGFAVRPSALVTDCAINDALDPASGRMVSVRLENFIEIMKAGLVSSADMIEIGDFVNALLKCISNNVPSDKYEARNMLVREGNWVHTILRYSSSSTSGFPYEKLIKDLMI